MTNNIDITAGIDVGNGYVKGKMVVDNGQPEMVDLPSCVVYRSNARDVPQIPTDELMADFVNEMDCDIASPAIKDTDRGRILVGRRAIASGLTSIVFDIDDHTPKCDDSLSYELILASLAGRALTDYWFANRELPTELLHVKVYIGVALPIADFTMYRETYRARLMGAVHTVHIHNFERDITIEIGFTGVEVLPEGAAAQYAIVDLGPEFMDLAIAEARQSGMMIDESETGESIVNYENTIGIDIGEGTVNFPVFRAGRPQVEASSSINHGYGTVLDRVVADTRTLNFAPQGRKDLAEFMLKQNPNARDRKLQARLQTFIDDQASVFAREVIDEYNRVLSHVKLGVDVVYVYGGGANPMRSTLYPALIEASRMDEDVYTPVIWLNSAYSRDLNRNGLYLIASQARAARNL